MSMFSSFDALMAESFGHKVGVSQSMITKERVVSTEKQVKEETPASNKDISVSKGKASPENQQHKPRKTRFAPELDGVHFFESIIPY